MKAENAALFVQVISWSVILAVEAYVAFTTRSIIDSMVALRDSIKNDPKQDLRKRVLDNEIKYYWIVHGVSVAFATISSLYILVAVLASGSTESASPAKKKKKSVKAASL